MRILFASYGSFDFSMIAPLFPVLDQRGHEYAILNRYDLAPSRAQLRGLHVFWPPKIATGHLSATQIERALPMFMDTRTVEDLIPLWRGRSPGLRFLHGWSDHYFDFALETLQRYDPDLTVVSLGEAETAIIRRVCELTSRPYACLVPQRYEFKSIEAFEDRSSATYMVAGEYGKERLIRKGIDGSRVVVTGNPRFDSFVSAVPRGDVPTKGAGARILFTLQGVSGEGKLFELLRRYVASRHEARLVIRPHPNLPLRSSLGYARFISPRISVAFRGSLGPLLRSADVLVTMWSLTVLEALIMGVPVISWKSDFLPDETPFASRGDTLPAHTSADLESALDRLLFDADFRRAWAARHRDAYIPYTGVLDGGAARRVAEAMAALVERGAAAHEFGAHL